MTDIDIVGDGLGYIKIFRKLMYSEIWVNPNLLKTFFYCLLKAVWKTQWVKITVGRGDKHVHVVRGSFIFGRYVAARDLDFSPSTTRNYIKKLEEIGLITIEVDTHYSIVSVVNFNKYQSEGKEVGQASDRQVTTKGQAKDTYNKDKKVEKDKKLTLREVVELYKDKIPNGPVPMKLTESRKRSFKARVNDFLGADTIEWWESYFNMVTERPWLVQEIEKKASWFSFDWLLNQNNMTKVLEGIKYMSSDSHSDSPSGEERQKMVERLQHLNAKARTPEGQTTAEWHESNDLQDKLRRWKQ